MKYHHVGIPTSGSFEGEIPLPHLKLTVSDHRNNPFGIQWQRYWEGAPYPDLVKTVAHVAFEVDDLQAAIKGQKVIIEPNSPSRGVVVAFIEVNGAPVELLQVDRTIRKDMWIEGQPATRSIRWQRWPARSPPARVGQAVNRPSARLPARKRWEKAEGRPD